MIKEGDRIKFTGEGLVTRADGGWLTIRMKNGTESVVNINAFDYEEVYKKFKSGDVVESIGAGNFIYTLGKDGYISHTDGSFFRYHGTPFTSQNYRKVY